MNKYCITSIRIFNYLVALLPLTMVVFLSIVYLFGGWENIIEGHDVNYYFLTKISFSALGVTIAVTWIAIAAFLVWIINILQKKIIKANKYKHLFCGIFIFLIAFGIRCLLVYIFADNLLPFSDFNYAWLRAQGRLDDGYINYYSIFPSYMTFSLYENKVILFFGENYYTVLFLNAVYSGITASLLYFLSKELEFNEVSCITSGIIYALYPSNIVFTTAGAPDFLAILFNTMGLLILLKSDKKEKDYHKLLLCLLGGVLLGIGGSFKSFSLVIVIAFSMTILVKHMLNCERRLVAFVSAVLMIAVVFVGYKGSSAIILEQTSDFYNIELDSKTATPHYLLVGLNTKSEGQIHLGSISRSYYQEYLSNGKDYEAAKDHALVLLKNDWRDNKRDILPNFGKKMIWAWQDDYIPVGFFLNNSGIYCNTISKKAIYNVLNNYGGLMTEVTYLGVFIFAIIGTVYFARSKKINFSFEVLALEIFGYFCLILLSEGQSRYKCLITGCVCIIASKGIDVLRSYVKSRWIDKRSIIDTGEK